MIVYRGGRRQRGYGIGGLFSSFFRKALPFLKDSAFSIGKNALGVASNVISDAERGGDVIQSIKRHGKKGALKTAKDVGYEAIKRSGDIWGDIIEPDTKRRRTDEEEEEDIYS